MIATSSGRGRYGNVFEALKQLNPKIRGKTLLKPNLVASGLAATQGEAVKAVLDSLSIDVIAEGSSVDTTQLYRSLGYTKLAREYGVELVDLNESEEWEEIDFLSIHGETVKVRVSRYARRYSVVSLTLPKTHDHAILTLSIKNMVGFLHPGDRSWVHGYKATLSRLMEVKPLRVLGSHLSRLKPLRRYLTVTDVEEERYVKGARVIHKNIATLAGHVKPELGVVDGFLGMQGRGPIAGEPLPWNIAIAGPPLECDVYCASKMGFDPAEVGYLHYLRAPALEEIEVIGDIPGKRFLPHPKIELQMRWRCK
jgi:uncharacterized protein (DUF362 family)